MTRVSHDKSYTYINICIKNYFTNHIMHSVLQFNTYLYSKGFLFLDTCIEFHILIFKIFSLNLEIKVMWFLKISLLNLKTYFKI